MIGKNYILQTLITLIKNLVTKKKMKKYIILTNLILIFISCKSQNIPLYNGQDYLETNGAYYKDTDGDLSKLAGVWIYNNGLEQLKIEFVFEINNMLTLNFNNPDLNVSCYQDVIYGELQYIDNLGVERINSLPNIDDNIDVSEHLLWGNFIKRPDGKPRCENCGPNERIIVLNYTDPVNNYLEYDIHIRHIPEDLVNNSPEKIELRIFTSDGILIPEGAIDEDIIPINLYTLIKQ